MTHKHKPKPREKYFKDIVLSIQDYKHSVWPKKIKDKGVYLIAINCILSLIIGISLCHLVYLKY